MLVATIIMATSEVATVVSTKKLENILVAPVISKPVPDHLTGTSKPTTDGGEALPWSSDQDDFML